MSSNEAQIELPSPTEERMATPHFEAVFQAIKSWDIDVGDGLADGNGSHVEIILRSLDPLVERGMKMTGSETGQGLIITSVDRENDPPQWLRVRDDSPRGFVEYRTYHLKSSDVPQQPPNPSNRSSPSGADAMEFQAVVRTIDRGRPHLGEPMRIGIEGQRFSEAITLEISGNMPCGLGASTLIEKSALNALEGARRVRVKIEVIDDG